MAGFYLPHSKHQERNRTDSDQECVQTHHTEVDVGEVDAQECHQLTENVEEMSLIESGCEPTVEEEDSDDEGWITPENFQQACEYMGGVQEELPQSLAVGCITTDFAMQVRNNPCSTPLMCMLL